MAIAPVLLVPRAIAADLARAVMGQDHLAEPARVVMALRIIGRRVAIVARAEMVAMMEVGAPRPDMMIPDNSRRGKAVAAAAKYGATAAEPTAMNGCTATAETTAVKSRATTAEAAATTAEAAATAAPKATTSAAATETAATMAVATPDFSRQSIRGIFR